MADIINEDRLRSWNHYYEGLQYLAENGKIDLPCIPKECEHNAHMFYIKAKDLDERTKLISYMKEHGIGCVYHYITLHSAPAGRRFGRFCGEDIYTTKESERLMRLPMYYGLKLEDIDRVIETIERFYK